jgi:HAD superfamily hydrolase (TIGR01549 family)
MRYGIKAIIFDAFGTLLTPVSRHGPYQELAMASKASVKRFRDEVMTLDMSISDFAIRYGRPDLAAELEAKLKEELAAVALFEEVRQYLSVLDQRGVPYVICSNLAQGYGERVKELVPGARGYAMSYEVGALKPQPKIYKVAINLVGSAPENTMFVGDTIGADVEGPQAVGIRAVHLNRSAGDTLASVLGDALRDATELPMLNT